MSSSAFLHRPATQVALAALLCFVDGSIYAVTVFTAAVDRVPALRGLWPPATAAMFALASLTMLLTALAQSAPPPPTHRASPGAGAVARASVATCALALALSGLVGAAALQARHRAALVAAVMLLAVPSGAPLVVAMHLLAAWASRRMGLAVGLSSVASGLGTVGGAAAVDAVLRRCAVPAAYARFMLAGSAVLALCAAALRVPCDRATQSLPPLSSPSSFPSDGGTAPDEQPLRGEHALSVRQLLALRAFWLYALVVLSLAASFPLIPYFFHIGAAHGAAQARQLRWYEGGAGLAIAVEPATAALCDYARARGGAGALGSGARNVAAGMLCVQAVLFGALSTADTDARFELWAAAVSALRLVYQSAFGVAALLAADFFGPRNTGLVFGVGAGVALGVGEGLATAVVVVVDRLFDRVDTAEHYKAFYTVGAIWSLIAIMALTSMRRLDVSRQATYV